MTKFTTIGYAKILKTKSGKDGIALTLDPDSRKEIYDHDYAEKIWLFPSQFGYVVMAPMKDDYEFKKYVKPVIRPVQEEIK
jgi:hypothetical protein